MPPERQASDGSIRQRSLELVHDDLPSLTILLDDVPLLCGKELKPVPVHPDAVDVPGVLLECHRIVILQLLLYPGIHEHLRLRLYRAAELPGCVNIFIRPSPPQELVRLQWQPHPLDDERIYR